MTSLKETTIHLNEVRIIRTKEQIKKEILECVSKKLDEVFEDAERKSSPREIELITWSFALAIGRQILSYLLSMQCQQASEDAIEKLGLKPNEVAYRFEKDCWMELRTLFGKIVIPLFAFRISRGGASVTLTPAREIFPYHRLCRSSELCLEWEARLGSDHPFRTAEEAITFFSHGAIKIEDTMISNHLVKVSALIRKEDLYKSKEEIQDILVNRATRDRSTGNPIIYLSSDAHAIRQYVDDTWNAMWKMANGIRLWCVDKFNGDTIHIGGEYTWGDCQAVRDIFIRLISSGILPADGDYGNGVQAKLVWVSDGMPWFKDWILPLFKSIDVILDAYHLLERIGKFLHRFFGRNGKLTKKGKQIYSDLVEKITGRSFGSKPKSAKQRKGTKKTKRSSDSTLDIHLPISMPSSDQVSSVVTSLLVIIFDIEKQLTKKTQRDACQRFLNYVVSNSSRMEYARYRVCGYQIGSGAMESLHRNASQIRLKLPGARWLKETSQAIFNFRMLRLVGNWDKFWSQPDFSSKLAASIVGKVAQNNNALCLENSYEKAA